LGCVRTDGARLGPRSRDRDRSRGADRHPPRLERLRRTRLSRADRVLAPNPVGGADPAALPDAGDDAEERDLPRLVRRVLAAPGADDVRGARRRSARNGHRPLVRRRAARAPSSPRTPSRPASSGSPSTSLRRRSSAASCAGTRRSMSRRAYAVVTVGAEIAVPLALLAAWQLWTASAHDPKFPRLSTILV